MASSNDELIEQLKSMTPTAFEQLTFDLVTFAGLRNAVWRTPGADGGRDIEGSHPFVDLSGSLRLEKWYVECKRYSKTVDWPTVHPKLSYAQNRKADYLLLVTTAALSPNCKTEIATHNSRGLPPLIRFWDATTLGKTVRNQPQLLVKYGLSAPEEQVVTALLPLSLSLARAVSAAYGRASSSIAVDSSLEFAAAAAELVWVRVGDATDGYPSRVATFDSKQDMYPWVQVASETEGRIHAFDRYGLRAIVSAVRYVSGAQEVSLGPGTTNQGLVITADEPRWPLEIASTSSLLMDLAFWSLVELSVRAENAIDLEPQNG